MAKIFVGTSGWVSAYFNNDVASFAVENAKSLIDLIT